MTEIRTRAFQNHVLDTSFLNKDKIDLSNIPQSLKKLIMVQTTEKLKQYQPQKCVIRCEQKITTLNTKELIELKKKRLNAVFSRGFLSDPKEHYRPLGDVYIDTEMLLYDNLQLEKGLRHFEINSDSQQFSREAQEEITQQKKHQAKIKMRFKERSKGHTDGFKYIKERLNQLKPT